MKDYILNLDRPRKLVFDFDAWDLIADKYDAKKEGVFDASRLNITAKEMPFLAFAGMRWEDPELTEEKTRTLLNQAIQSGTQTVLSIVGAVSEAVFTQTGLQKVPVEVETSEDLKGEASKKAAGPIATVPGSRKKGK